MPRKNGLEATKEIRQLEGKPRSSLRPLAAELDAHDSLPILVSCCFSADGLLPGRQLFVFCSQLLASSIPFNRLMIFILFPFHSILSVSGNARKGQIDLALEAGGAFFISLSLLLRVIC
jgi:hypothetical protein